MEEIAAGGARAVILREKDLDAQRYQDLAEQVLPLCEKHGVRCILHSHPHTAMALGAKALHLPLPLLRELPESQRNFFEILGASCHSLEDVQEAQHLGCTYVTLGHIFATDCKKGLPPRGLSLLRNVCAASFIPVYAIGGICPENVDSVREAGAAGACLMSSLMTCPDPAALLRDLMPHH